MAFNFAAASTGGGGFSFGAAATPATPAASQPLFGAAAPTFGAAATPAGGVAPTPAFGAAPATGSLFSTTPTPAFGAASAPPPTSSAFGTPFPTASQPQQATGAFSFATATSQPQAAGGLFGTTTTTLATSQPATGSLFAPAATAGTAFGGQTQQQQQGGAAVGGGQITYSTKWEEIPPNLQQQLTQLQQAISGYRADCDKLEADPRLHDAAELKRSVHADTDALRRSLQGLLNAVSADDDAMLAFREKVTRLLHSSEAAVRTYQRDKLWREAAPGQGLPPQVQEQLAAPVVLPSPYLEAAVAAFEDALAAHRRVVSDLEQALPPVGASRGGGGEAGGGALVTALPGIVSGLNTHLFHVAAMLESLHRKVHAAKEAHLRQRRAAGDFTDPFRRAPPAALAALQDGASLYPAHAANGSSNGSHHANGAAQQQAPGTPQPGVPLLMPPTSPGLFGTPQGQQQQQQSRPSNSRSRSRR